MLRSDASQMRAVARELRKAQPAMVRAVQRAVKEVAKDVAQAAADQAKWSTRIPGTIKVGASGLIGAKITAGGPTAPHAPAYEHEGQRGKFRHPLNYPTQGAKQHWVSQTARPFLHPAALSRVDLIRSALLDAALMAIKESLRKSG